MERRTWTAALAAFAICGASALAQPPGPPTQNAPSVPASAPAPVRPVAVVNGVPISAEKLRAALDAAPAALSLTAAHQRKRQAEALQPLIDAVLIAQFLDAQKVPAPTSAEVERHLAEMGTRLAAQRMTLEQFLQDTNQTKEQYRAAVADHLRWAGYVTKAVTDETLAAFHKANRDFFDQATVEASHLVLHVSRTAPDEAKSAARQQLAQVRQRLAADAKLDFAAVARQCAEQVPDARYAELGTFPRRWEFDEPFLAAAFALKPGEVSGVVETDYGFHLIKVTKRNDGTPTEFAKVKDWVREVYAGDERQRVLEQQRKAGRIEINLP